MFPDLDKSSAYICRSSFADGTLDVCSEDILVNAVLYEDLSKKKELIDHLRYDVPFFFPIGNNEVINVRNFLNYDGRKFVYMAYIHFLGRIPERSSLNALLTSLTADNSREAKIRHLNTIAFSEEAKKRNLIITGYDNVNLQDLLSFTDRAFIHNAYIRILFRKPDAEGMRNYLSLLRSAEYSPIEILYMIRHSPEGESNGVCIQGLDEERNKIVKRKKFYSTPVVGKFCKKLASFKNLNRRIDELRDENYRLRDALSNEVDKLSRQYSISNSQIINRIDSESGRLTNLNHRIDRYGDSLLRLSVVESALKSNNDKIEKAGIIIGELSDNVAMYAEDVSEIKTSVCVIDDNVAELNNRSRYYDSILDEQSEAITKLAEDAHNRAVSYDDIIKTLDGYAHQIGDNVAELNNRSEHYDSVLNEQSKAITKLAEDAHNRAVSYDDIIRNLDGYAHQIGDNVNDLNKSVAGHDEVLASYNSEDKKTIQMLLAEVFSLKAKIKRLESASVPMADVTNAVTTHDIVETDTYSSIDYFDFENHFRGSREHVKNVQKIYIPYFEGKKNVLDLGCGRGEFTELLLENGIGVTGVDQYEPYVEYMKSMNLPAVYGDAVKYLNAQESTDGIFMGQVVEHISIDMIVEICRMAYEKLEEGCCLIMETPNPKSLAIFTECFYIDPSHQKPVHPYTLKYIAEKAGFSKVDIIYTDSSRMPFDIPRIKESDPDFKQFNEAMQRVSELLYGSQDYAVIARK